MNGVPLDGSQHDYTLTFPAGDLPPVNAFWSVTMYDGTTQLLIDNPINRYLINSPMLPDLKKNPDGSLTIYIQHESPGKDREFELAARPRRADVRRDAALLAEDRGALDPAAGRGNLGAAGHHPGQQRPRPGRDALRRQVAGDGDPHRPALWRRQLLPGSARLALLEPAGIPQADPEPQPLARHPVDLFHLPLRHAGGQHADPARAVPAGALLQARALQGAGRHVRLDRRGSRRQGHRARPRLDQPVRGRQWPSGRAARLHRHASSREEPPPTRRTGWRTRSMSARMAATGRW